jgi:serine protease Do
VRSRHTTVGRVSRNLLFTAAVAAAAGPLTVLGSLPAANAQTAASAPAADTSIERTVALVQPGTVRLQMDWHAYVDTGDDFGRLGPFDVSTSCTGFIVDPSGYIVTAGHCLDSSIEGLGGNLLRELIDAIVAEGVITPAQAQSPELAEYIVGHWQVEGQAANSPADVSVTVGQGIALSGEKDVKGNRARVIEVNPPSKGDVALIKTEAHDLPIVRLADDKDLDVGTSVLAVGYPGTSDQATDASMTATFKDGKISSKKTREGGLLPVYEVSAAMSQGMSGGPTVTVAGNVVGLNSFYPAGENQQFNFLSPVSLIKETLTRNGVRNEPATVDQGYHQAVDAYYTGDYRTAVAKLDEVLQRQPSHQQAQALRTKAMDKAATQPAPVVTPVSATSPDSGGAPVVVLLAAGLAVLVLGGVGVAVVLTRGRGRPAGAVGSPVTAPAGPGGPTMGGTPLAPSAPAGPATFPLPRSSPPPVRPARPGPLRSPPPPPDLAFRSRRRDLAFRPRRPDLAFRSRRPARSAVSAVTRRATRTGSARPAATTCGWER